MPAFILILFFPLVPSPIPCFFCSIFVPLS
jgi:hypothetical protein